MLAITAAAETQAGISSPQQLALENGASTLDQNEVNTKPHSSDTNRQEIQAHIPSDPNVRLNLMDATGKKLLEDGDLHHTLTLHSTQKHPHMTSGHNLGGDADQRNAPYGNSYHLVVGG